MTDVVQLRIASIRLGRCWSLAVSLRSFRRECAARKTKMLTTGEQSKAAMIERGWR
jgi:hypothetical protein